MAVLMFELFCMAALFLMFCEVAALAWELGYEVHLSNKRLRPWR